MKNNKQNIIGLLIAMVLLGLSNLAKAQDEVPVPQNLTATEIDNHSALLTWNGQEGILKYIVQYNVAMSENVIEVQTNDTSLYIDNLLSATQYLWKIRAISVNMDTSVFTNVHSFYTDGILNDCGQVSHLNIWASNETDFALSWNSEDYNGYWEVVCDEIGTNPDDIGKRYFTTNTEYVFNNLQKGLTYQFAVRSHCDSGIGNWKYLYANYTFASLLPTLPLEIDFSDNDSKNSVGIVSGNTNGFIINDIAVINNGVSEKCLYISNDNGQSATFNLKKTSTSYAYIDFQIPEDCNGFYLDFDYWTATQLQSNGMKVFLTSVGSNLDIDSTIESIYQVGDSSYSNSNGEWTKAHVDFSDELVGKQQRIVFMWHNTADSTDSNSTEENLSSIAIKNIKISPLYCPIPDSINAKNITYNSAEIVWALDYYQQSFNLEYKKGEDSVWTVINNIFPGFVIDSLEENTTYLYRLQANCSADKSYFSQLQSFTTQEFLGIVDKNTVEIQVSYHSADIEWQDKENVKFYRIKYKPNDVSSEWKDKQTGFNYITLDSLMENTEYVFKISLTDMMDNQGQYTEEMFFTTHCAPVTQYPYELDEEIEYYSSLEYADEEADEQYIKNTFTNLPSCYDTSLSVINTPIFDISSLSAAVLSFDIYGSNNVYLYISKNGGESFTFFDNITLSDIENDAPLHKVYILDDYIMENNMQMRFVFNVTGTENVYTKIANITMTEACVSPKSIDFDTIGTDFFTVSWNNNTMATSWVAKLYNANDSLLKSYTIGSASCTFSSLQENTLYKLVIKSLCAGQESYDSLYTYVTTTSFDYAICHTPKDFKAYHYQTKGDETILAKWTPEGDEKIWEVWYKDLYAMNWNQKIVTLVPQFSLRNLNEGEAYELKVRAICSVGDTSEFTQTDTVVIETSSLQTIQETLPLVYPNPTNGIITVEGNVSKMMITDCYGKIVKYVEDKDFNTEKRTINLEDLPSGSYFLVGYTEEKRFVEIIIKQ